MNPAPLVILSMDCGDPDLLGRWMADGSLPTLAGLRQRGAYARLASPEQAVEHGTPLSLYSGVPRGTHGYYNFRQIELGTYRPRRFSPRDTGVLPFWSRLRGQGQRVLILDANECALVPGLPGYQVANWASHQPTLPHLPPEAEPAGLLAEVEQMYGPRVPGVEYLPKPSATEDQRDRERYLTRIRRKGGLARALLERGPYDLIVIEFDEAHTGGHRFWPPRLSDGLSAPGGDAIREFYCAIDRELGEILARLPAEANVVFFTHCGMQSLYPMGPLMADFCRKLGYVTPPPPATRPPRTPLELARRILPERLRRMLSGRLPPATQEQLLRDQFAVSADWSRTTAFAHLDYFVGLFQVNLRGREPQGTVAPGAEYTAVLDRLEADLRQLIDPLTGQSPIHNIARAADIYGDLPSAYLPDLYVHWKECSHFVPRLKHPRATITQPRPNFFRNSGHYFESLAILAGPAVECCGDIGRASVIDITPTCLALMGLPPATDLPGHAIAGVGGI